MSELEKTKIYRIASEAIIEIHKKSLINLFDNLWSKPVCDLSLCKRCGYVSDNKDFSFPTGVDDYYIECPNCYASENFIVDITDIKGE